VEAARRLREEYGGAVWFIPLASLRSESQLIAALTHSLNPQNPGIAESSSQLAESIGLSPMLLVLDNFEQMGDDSALTVRLLLQRAPGLRVLVTSRRPLNVEGEQQFNLPPLPVPESEDAGDDLMQNPSVRLFVARAMRTKSDFNVSDTNAADIAALCRQLEGMPLALELAAGWVSSLSPSQIGDRLSRRFDLLVTRRTDIDERHRSLLSAISWSYEQLPTNLQRLFARLSVFRGGWTLEAAEAVCREPSGSTAPSPFFL
jgi:predicted ATPase